MSGYFDALEQRLRTSAEARGDAPALADAERAQAGGAHAARQRGRGATAPGRRARRPLLVLLLALLVAGGAVPAVTAISGLWDPGVPAQRPWGNSVTATETWTCRARTPAFRPGPPVGPEFAEAFAVFDRPARPGDRMRRAYLRSLPLLEIDVERIRLLGRDAAGRPVHIVPGQGMGHRVAESCLRGMTAQERRRILGPTLDEPAICVDGGCDTLRELARRGSFGSSGTVRGRATITTVVPNGVRAVRVAYGHASRTFPVRDNFASFRVAIDVEQASSPDRVEWLMDDGSVRDVTFRPR